MKTMKKVLSLEQKISVIDFVVKRIKSGKDIEEGVTSSTFLIRDGKIMYMLSMDIFHKENISSIVVMNYDLDVSISVDMGDLPVQIKSDIKFIENYIQGFIISIGRGQDLTDLEFNKITNLEPDIMLSRSKKINHLKDIIDDTKI